MLLSRAQAAFLDSKATFRGFVGGRGAGKSFCGAYDLIRRAKPGRLYMAVAPTYQMMKDGTIRMFLGMAERIGLPLKLNKVDMWARLPNGAEVLFRSADDPERLRGPNLSGAWIDEASLTAVETYEILIATLREAGEQGWLSATFTPKGKRHWTYDVFGLAKPHTFLAHCRTADNPFLPPEFEAVVRGQYTSHLAAQELGGEFLESAGSLFDVSRLVYADVRPTVASRVRYWDKAGTQGGGDYSAGVLLSRAPDGRFWVEHVRRGQWSAGGRNAVIAETAAADRRAADYRGGVTTWLEQEPGSGGKESAELSVRELAGYAVFAERVTGDKATRAAPLAAQIEVGNVGLIRGDWNADFVDELASFPGGKHDDQVDAAAGAFNKLAAGLGRHEMPGTAADGETLHEQLPADTFD